MMSVRISCLWAILVATMLPGAAGAANLFLTNAPERSFEVSSDEPVDWIRARPAELDMDAITSWMSGDGLGLNLFDDVVLHAEFLPDVDDTEGSLPAGVVWRYAPSGEVREEGTVVLVREADGEIHGEIHVRDAIYEILPSDTPPLHLIVERPPERDLGCATTVAARDDVSHPMSGAAGTEAPPPVPWEGEIIRVLMLQTAESSYADWHGWVFFGVDMGAIFRQMIDSRISAAFKRARMAFIMSGTTVRIASATAKALKLSYSEFPFLSDDINALSQHDLDGHITGLRDAYKADVVFLWRRSSDPGSGGACGMAVGQNRGYASPNVAYAVGSHGCFKSVFAHEIGHLLGAQHDFIEDGPTPHHLFAESAFGYFAPYGGQWYGVANRTVMSYFTSCIPAGFGACMEINYFSTPQVTVNGVQIGRSGGTTNSPGAHNAKVIDFMGPNVANYR